MNRNVWMGWLAILWLAVLLPACSSGGSGEAVITIQPSGQSVVVGSTATFSVAASDATGYQWERSSDGGTTYVVIPGASSSSYSMAVTELTQNGLLFRVVISGTNNTVTSSAALLTVSPAIVAPTISIQPANQSAVEGGDASFSVTAGGTELTYQWSRSTDGGSNYVDIAGATSATLNLTNVALAESGDIFRVKVSNLSGSVYSAQATLTVSVATVAPQITTQPANVSVTAGQGASFSVVASGVPTPTLQWQRSVDNGATWSDISGATSATYTLTATVTGDNGSKFRAVAMNSVGSVTSNPATLTVTTATYAWGPAPNLRFVDVGNTTQYSQYVDFAMNDNGDAVAIWLQDDGTGSNRSNLWTNRFSVASKTWGTPTLIETSDFGIGYQINPLEGPRVAMNSDGAAVAVWVQSNGTNSQVWANRMAADGAWGTAQMIDVTYGESYRPSAAPRVAIDGNGKAIAAWHKYDGSLHNIWVNHMAVDGTWGAPLGLEVNNTQGAVYPSVAMSSAGKAVVAWNWCENFCSNFKDVAASYFDGSGWSAGQNISVGAGAAGSSARPEVGIDANGDAVAAWKQLDGTTLNIVAARYAGAWGSPVRISDGVTHAWGVNLAMNAAGGAVAIWTQYGNPEQTQTNVLASRYVSGSWGVATLVEGFAEQPAADPQAALNSAGNAMVLMGRIVTPAQPGRLRANRAVAGGDWGTDVAVDGTSYSGAPVSGRIAVDGSGRAMALWIQESNGSNYRVYYNRYE